MINETDHIWQSYLSEHPRPLEIIPGKLYSTEFYECNKTTNLRFFVNVGAHISRTNMQIAGMLPAPCSFLIESIRIDGISTNIRYGACVLHIGNKHYGYNPAWTYSLKEKGFKLHPKLMIPPMMSFCFDIWWERPEDLGTGLTGKPINVRPIQVVMYGQLARAIQ